MMALRAGMLKASYSVFARLWLRDFPHAVRIESTNACNADCVICPRCKMTRPVGFMDMGLYRKLIEECGRRRLSTVHLHNYGEPLLDPDLIERIRWARAAGVANVRIFTNGALLTPELGERLIESGLTELRVSIDGLNVQTFESLRRGLKLDEVRTRLERFVRQRNDKGRRHPKVGVIFTQTPKNEAETDDFLHYWQSRVDHVFISRFHNWGGQWRKKRSADSKQSVWPCSRLWTTFTVLWDGRVSLCCMDYNGEVILGDVHRQTIGEIFHGEPLARVRSCFFRGNLREIPLCGSCSLHHRRRVRWSDEDE